MAQHAIEHYSMATCTVTQAAGEETQGRLDASNAELTAAERALANVNEQMRALHAAQPTGGAAVRKSTGARNNAHGGTKRASDRQSNHLISPNDQKKKPRRSPALLPKHILQSHK